MPSINIGDIQKNLQVIAKLPKGNMICLCLLCQKEHTIHRSKFGRDKSCGCARVSKGKENCHFKGYEEIHAGKWYSYKRNAIKRSIEFNVSIEYAWSIYLAQNRQCAITKMPISFWENATDRQATASLDRIDNSKGYIEGNIHWVHKKVNQIKMDMSLNDFIDLCKLVAKQNE